MKTKVVITGILGENLSNTCFSEVSTELINELYEDNGDNVWTILNDHLSNAALDELEYETTGLQDLIKYIKG